MDYSTQYNAFHDDKQRFFSAARRTSATNTVADAWDQLGIEKPNYAFLANHYGLFEQELRDLRDVLEKRPGDKREFWLYSYYCCAMLHEYYRIYDEKKEVKKYRKLALKIQTTFELGHAGASSGGTAGKHQPSFVAYVITGMLEGVRGLRFTGEIRDWIGFLNIRRIYWIFCRLTMIETFQNGGFSQLFDWVDSLMDKHTDINHVIDVMQLPNKWLMQLSVGIFAARFILNTGLVMKHAWGSVEEASLSWKERMFHEMNLRKGQLINDVVWCTANAVTGYPKYFNLSNTAASWGVSAFLVFDVTLLLFCHAWDHEQYMVKKAQYLHEKELSCLSKDWAAHWVLEQQLESLELAWQVSSAKYGFNIAAATLLMVGFSASMLVAFPVLVPYCYLLSATGVALYMSDTSYSQYKEKSLLRDRARLQGGGMSQAEIAYAAQRNEFVMTVIKNVCVPLVMVPLVAACWQAALLLVVCGVGYTVAGAYHNATEKEPEEPLAMLPGFF